jgi:glutaminyl-peptide cyclotransferase
MIGDADQQIYLEQTSTEALRAEIWQVAADLGYATFIPEVKHSVIDDHTAFLAQGYPAVDLIDFDYPYWHTTADTLDKLSAPALESVGRTLEVWVTRD